MRGTPLLALATALAVLLRAGGCFCREAGNAGRESRPAGEDADADGLFHAVFPVECKLGFLLWQTIGLWYSFRKVKQPGSFTRLLACAEDKRDEFRLAGGMDVCPTHVTPSYTDFSPGDSYGPYNMAGTVLHWVTHVSPREKFVLILDSDMVLLRPMRPADIGLGSWLEPGWAVGAFYGYLQGVNNSLALRHAREVAPRLDELAGPPGRRGDQVGGVQAMALSDLRRVAPLWLEYTKRVREDPEAWADTGDVYVSQGGRPWISEMYGYSFGCAKAGVWHVANRTMMLYPEYQPSGVASVMHYGIHFEIPGEDEGRPIYSFHKHWFSQFDAFKCPPWDGQQGARRSEGLLPAPPRPSELPPAEPGMPRLRHLYASATIATLNEAFCERHLRRCDLTPELLDACAEAVRLSDAVFTELRREEAAHLGEAVAGKPRCRDYSPYCADWAAKGECWRNPSFMRDSCSKACGVCSDAAVDSPPSGSGSPVKEEL